MEGYVYEEREITAAIHEAVTADETGVPVHAELDKPICRLCKKTVPAKRSNTTNLFTHLEDHHPVFFLKLYQQHPVFRNESRLHW